MVEASKAHRSMRTYRIFKLGRGGCVLDAQWIEALDDSDAATQAAEFGLGTRCEIWECDRLVGMSEPFGVGSPTFCPRWPASRSPYAEEHIDPVP